jgi:hypothetical protein
MISQENQSLIVDGVCHEAMMAGRTWREVAWQYERPSVMFRPKVFIDEGVWCALYGENLQDGVCGYGESPDKAMRAFDNAWLADPPKPTGAPS